MLCWRGSRAPRAILLPLCILLCVVLWAAYRDRGSFTQVAGIFPSLDSQNYLFRTPQRPGKASPVQQFGLHRETQDESPEEQLEHQTPRKELQDEGPKKELQYEFPKHESSTVTEVQKTSSSVSPAITEKLALSSRATQSILAMQPTLVSRAATSSQLPGSAVSETSKPSAKSNYYRNIIHKGTTELQGLLTQQFPKPDLAKKGQRVDILATLLDAILEDPILDRSEILHHIHKEFDWWRPGDETYKPWSSTNASEMGIVMCFGSHDVYLAAHNIRILRDVLNSTLSIEIYYAGADDMAPWDQERIRSLGPSISLWNIYDYINEDIAAIHSALEQGVGYAMKAMAMMASRFDKVILVDADVVFLQSPDAWFDKAAGTKDTGTLFFHDRALEGDFTDWVLGVLDGRPPSASINDSLLFTQKMQHCQESGVVLMDKSRPRLFMSLLFAGWMNTRDVREVLYEHIWGDKETFWLACELSSTPYTFNPSYPGMLGSMPPSSYYEQQADFKAMCRPQILHFEPTNDDQPLWFNEGLRNDKWDGGNEDLGPFTHFVRGGRIWEELPRWFWVEGSKICLPTEVEGRVRSLESVGVGGLMERILEVGREVNRKFVEGY